MLEQLPLGQQIVLGAIIFIGIIVLGLFVADYHAKCRENKRLKKAFEVADKFAGFQQDLIEELTPKRDSKGRFTKK